MPSVSPAAYASPFDASLCSAPVEIAADEPALSATREQFYGWQMVALTTVVLVASSPGQTFGFTYFNPWLRRALSLSQTELSATYLFATLLAAAPLGYIGAIVDRIGLRRSMLAAVAAMAAACLLGAAVQNVPMLFVACFAMRLVGPGVMTILANNTLAAWFDRRLGKATSAMQLGMAAAIALVPIGIMALISSVGWREAYAVLGLLLAVGVLPLVWWAFREHPAELGQHRDGFAAATVAADESLSVGFIVAGDSDESWELSAALRTRAFWILVAATSMWSMIGTGLIFHLDALLSSRGLSPSETAWATPVMASCMAVMQLMGAGLADRAAPGKLAAVALTMVAGACVAFASGHGASLIAAYGVYGLAQGIMSLVSTTVWARYFGRLHLGRIRGTALTAAISASAAGPLVMGASTDFLGGFEPSLWVLAACAVATAAICPLAVRPEAARGSGASLSLAAAA